MESDTGLLPSLLFRYHMIWEATKGSLVTLGVLEYASGMIVRVMAAVPTASSGD